MTIAPTKLMERPTMSTTTPEMPPVVPEPPGHAGLLLDSTFCTINEARVFNGRKSTTLDCFTPFPRRVHLCTDHIPCRCEKSCNWRIIVAGAKKKSTTTIKLCANDKNVNMIRKIHLPIWIESFSGYYFWITYRFYILLQPFDDIRSFLSSLDH